MTKLIVLLAVLIGCSHAPYGGSGSSASSSPSGSDYQIRAYDVQTLDNGLKIIWVQDERLPVVSLAMAVHGGGNLDPQGREGLADMTAQLLDKGVPGMNAMQIAENLEQRADAFGATVDSDAVWLGIRGLSFHKEDSLKNFFDLVTKPTFPQGEVNRQKQLTIARLKRLVDRPADFTSLVYSRYIFGDHPYGHDAVGTEKSIGHMTRKDIVEFHKNNYSPDRAALAVVGQFDDQFKTNVIATFSAWKSAGAKKIELPQPKPEPGLSILEVEKPELQQTEVRMGHIGVKRNIPDHLPLRVATAILGDPGSFTARLFNEIRVKRGLTYGVRAQFDQRLEAGPFTVSTFTRNDKIHEMVGELLKVFKDFHEKGVTKAEVESAKSSLKGRFPNVVETGDDLAHQLLILDLYGVPFDYLKTFPKEIEKVTVEQVNAAIKEHFQPQNLKFVIFGPEGSPGMKSVKEFGPVKVESYKKAL